MNINDNTNAPQQVARNVWMVPDSCNVYLVKQGDRGIAIDFGTGKCLAHLQDLGIRKLDHVFLTHHHADQCLGLSARDDWPFAIHAPQGEEGFIAPAEVRVRHERLGRTVFFPESYELLKQGIAQVAYDMVGFYPSLFWGLERIRFMATPGHGQHACSVILDSDDKQIVFCGDAVYDGGKMWHLYNLEWDHWTGTGTLQAWRGVKQLNDIAIDILCPSHGPVLDQAPHRHLALLTDRLMRLYDCKNAISPDEPDRYLQPRSVAAGYEEVLPGLFHFGENGYLLVSAAGKGLVVDPYTADLEVFELLLAERLPDLSIAAAVTTHSHGDHNDAMNHLREKYRTRLIVHPTILDAVEHAGVGAPQNFVEPDEVWPERGSWQWEEFTFSIDHLPGQTWWHTGFMTVIAGQKVFFSGDSFQADTRWNGTGGFCANFKTRFRDGFVVSAQRIIDWNPDIVAPGHGAYYRFSAGKFRKIMQWAERTEDTLRDLCPEGDMTAHYYEALPKAGGRVVANLETMKRIRKLRKQMT